MSHKIVCHYRRTQTPKKRHFGLTPFKRKMAKLCQENDALLLFTTHPSACVHSDWENVPGWAWRTGRSQKGFGAFTAVNGGKRSDFKSCFEQENGSTTETPLKEIVETFLLISYHIRGESLSELFIKAATNSPYWLSKTHWKSLTVLLCIDKADFTIQLISFTYIFPQTTERGMPELGGLFPHPQRYYLSADPHLTVLSGVVLCPGSSLVFKPAFHRHHYRLCFLQCRHSATLLWTSCCLAPAQPPNNLRP